MSLSPAQANFFGPFHLVTCSTLLGTQLFQSFINTKICYALPRSAFTTLQKRLFPIYFKVQSVLVLTTIITYPLGPRGLLSSPKDLVPLILAGITACANFFVFGPQTLTTMVCCVHQETTDKKNGIPVGEVSEDMRAFRRAFSRNHAMSIHLNLLTIGSTLWYGVRLGMHLNFVDQSS
ncbi:hypothetical protein BN1723_004359 [Verticillium longisporum]|uniref:TMEM205-like domain-containing protein n=1 Tax=Verticillium longisporum TaxID=100787 RepID=A0A0G4MV60_VERLO|nr:hypothetical protein BN1723_004359 [Verticillium longisporum]